MVVDHLLLIPIKLIISVPFWGILTFFGLLFPVNGEMDDVQERRQDTLIETVSNSRSVFMNSKFRYTFSMVFAAIALMIPLTVQAGSMDFHHGWIRAMPPGSMMSAAYGVLVNSGSEDRRLVNVAVEGFGQAQIHQSTMQKGMANMVQQKNLTIAAGKEFALAPGGFHLMLLHPKGPFRPGETRKLTLIFDDGTSVTVPVRIQKGPGTGMPMQHGMQHGSNMNHKPCMHHGAGMNPQTCMKNHSQGMMNHNPAMMNHNPAMMNHNPAMMNHNPAMMNHNQ